MPLTVGEIEATIRLRDEMSARLANLRQTTQGFGKDLQDLANKASQAGKEFDDAFRNLNRTVTQTEQATANLGKSITTSTDGMQEGAKDAKTFAERLAEVAGQANTTGRSVVGACNQIAAAVKGVVELPGQIKESFLDPITNTINRLGTSLTVGLTVPITGFAVGAAKAAISFESAFAGVRKTVDGVNDSVGRLTEFGETLRSKLRAMATDEIPLAVDELAKIAEIGGQLGVSSTGITQFTKVIAELADTTDLTLESAAVGVAQLGNIMGIAQNDFDRLGSTLDRLGSESVATESAILDMSVRLAASGKIAGLSTANVLAYATALSSVGVEAEAGGTAFSKIFQKIFESVKTGNADLKVFAKTAGQSTADFAAAFRQDPASAIASFVEGLKRTSDQGENVFATLKDVEFQDARLKRAILSLSEASDLLRVSIAKGNEEWRNNNYLAREAGIRWQTTASQLTRLWSRVKDLGIIVGNALNPGIKAAISLATALLGPVAKLAEAFGKLPGFVQVLVIGFVALLAAMGPLVLVLLHVTKLFLVFSTLSTVNTALKLFSGSLGVTSGAIASLTANMGPFVGGLLRGLDSSGALTVAFVGMSGAAQRFGRFVLDLIRPLFSLSGIFEVLKNALTGTAELFGRIGLALINLIGWPKLLIVALVALVATIPTTRHAFLDLLKILELIASIVATHIVAAFTVLGKAAQQLGQHIGDILRWMAAHIPFFDQLGKAADHVASFFTKFADALGLLNDEGWVSETIVAALAVAIVLLAGRSIISQISTLVTVLRAVGGGVAGATRALLGLGRATREVVVDTKGATSAGMKLGAALAGGLGKLAGYTARFGAFTAGATKSAVAMGVATAAAYGYEAAIKLSTVTTDQWVAATGPVLRAGKQLAEEYAFIIVAVQKFAASVRASSTAFGTRVFDGLRTTLTALGINMTTVGSAVRTVTAAFRTASAPVLTYIQLQLALIRTYGFAQIAAVKLGRSLGLSVTALTAVGRAVLAVVTPIKNFYQSYVLLENVAAIVGAALGYSVRGIEAIGRATAAGVSGLARLAKTYLTVDTAVKVATSGFGLVVRGLAATKEAALGAVIGFAKMVPQLFATSKMFLFVAQSALSSVAAPAAVGAAYTVMGQAVAAAALPFQLLHGAMVLAERGLNKMGISLGLLRNATIAVGTVVTGFERVMDRLFAGAFQNMQRAVAATPLVFRQLTLALNILTSVIEGSFAALGRFIRQAGLLGEAVGKIISSSFALAVAITSGDKAMIAQIIRMLGLEGVMLRITTVTASLIAGTGLYTLRLLRLAEVLATALLTFGKMATEAIRLRSVLLGMAAVTESVGIVIAGVGREFRAWSFIARELVTVPREIGLAFLRMGNAMLSTATGQKAVAVGARVISTAWRGIRTEAASATSAFYATSAGMNIATAAAFVMTQAMQVGLRATLGFATGARVALATVAVRAKDAALGISAFYGQIGAAFKAFTERAEAAGISTTFTLKALKDVRAAMLAIAQGLVGFGKGAATGVQLMGRLAGEAAFRLRKAGEETVALTLYNDAFSRGAAKAAGSTRTIAATAELARRASKELAGALGATATEAQAVGATAGYATRAWLGLVAVARTLVRALATGAAGAVDLVAAALTRVGKMALNISAVTGLDIVWRRVAAAANAANVSFRSLNATISVTSAVTRLVTAARERLLITERSAVAQAAITAQLLRANDAAMRAAGAGAGFFARALVVIDRLIDNVLGRLGVMRAAVLSTVAGQRAAAAAANVFGTANRILWATLDGIILRVPALRKLTLALATAERISILTANALSAARIRLAGSFAAGGNFIESIRGKLTFLNVLEKASIATQEGLAAARVRLTAAYGQQATRARTLGAALAVVTAVERTVIAVNNLVVTSFLKAAQAMYQFERMGFEATSVAYVASAAWAKLQGATAWFAALPPIVTRAGLAFAGLSLRVLALRVGLLALGAPAAVARLAIAGIALTLDLLFSKLSISRAQLAFMERGTAAYGIQLAKSTLLMLAWKAAVLVGVPAGRALNGVLSLTTRLSSALVPAQAAMRAAFVATATGAKIASLATRAYGTALEFIAALKTVGPTAKLAFTLTMLGARVDILRKSLGLANAVIRAFEATEAGANVAAGKLVVGLLTFKSGFASATRQILSGGAALLAWKAASILLYAPFQLATKTIATFDRGVSEVMPAILRFAISLKSVTSSTQPMVRGLALTLGWLNNITRALTSAMIKGTGWSAVLVAMSTGLNRWAANSKTGLAVQTFITQAVERTTGALTALSRAFGLTRVMAIFRGALTGVVGTFRFFSALITVAPLAMLSAKLTLANAALRALKAGAGVATTVLNVFNLTADRVLDALSRMSLGFEMIRLKFRGAIQMTLSGIGAFAKWGAALYAMIVPATAATTSLTVLQRLVNTTGKAFATYRMSLVGASKSTQPFVSGLVAIIDYVHRVADAVSRAVFTGLGWSKAMRGIGVYTTELIGRSTILTRVIDGLVTGFDNVGQAVGRRLVTAFQTLAGSTTILTGLGERITTTFDRLAQMIGRGLVGSFGALTARLASGFDVLTSKTKLFTSSLVELVSGLRIMSAIGSVATGVQGRLAASLIARKGEGATTVTGTPANKGNIVSLAATLALTKALGAAQQATAAATRAATAVMALYARGLSAVQGLLSKSGGILNVFRAALLALNINFSVGVSVVQQFARGILTSLSRMATSARFLLLDVVAALRLFRASFIAALTSSVQASGIILTLTTVRAAIASTIVSMIAFARSGTVLTTLTGAFTAMGQAVRNTFLTSFGGVMSKALSGLRAFLAADAAAVIKFSDAFLYAAQNGRKAALGIVGASAAMDAAGKTTALAASRFTGLGIAIGGLVHFAGVALFIAALGSGVAELGRLLIPVITGQKSFTESLRDCWNALKSGNFAIGSVLEMLGLYESAATKAKRAQEEFNDEVKRMSDEFSGATFAKEVVAVKRSFDEMVAAGKLTPAALDGVRKKLIELQATAKEKGFDLDYIAPWINAVTSGAIIGNLTSGVDNIIAQATRLREARENANKGLMADSDQLGVLDKIAGYFNLFTTLGKNLRSEVQQGLDKKALTDFAKGLENLIALSKALGKQIDIGDKGRAILFDFGSIAPAIEHARKLGQQFEKLKGDPTTSAETLKRAANALGKELLKIQQASGGLPEWANNLLKAYPVLASAFTLLKQLAGGSATTATVTVKSDPKQWTNLVNAAKAAGKRISGSLLAEIKNGLTAGADDDKTFDDFIKHLEAIGAPKGLNKEQWKIIFKDITEGADKAGHAAERFLAKFSGKEAADHLKLMTATLHKLNDEQLANLSSDTIGDFLKTLTEVRHTQQQVATGADDVATRLRAVYGSALKKDALSKAFTELENSINVLKGEDLNVTPVVNLREFEENLRKMEVETGVTVASMVGDVGDKSRLLHAAVMTILPGRELTESTRQAIEDVFKTPPTLDTLRAEVDKLSIEFQDKLAKNGRITGEEIEEVGEKAVLLAARLRDTSGEIAVWAERIGTVWLGLHGVSSAILDLPAEELPRKLAIARSAVDDNRAAIIRLKDEIEDLGVASGPDTLETKLASESRAYARIVRDLEKINSEGGEFADNVGPRMTEEAERHAKTVAKIKEEWLLNGRVTKNQLQALAVEAATRFNAMKASGKFSAEAIEAAWEDMIAANIAMLGKWAAQAAELFDGIGNVVGSEFAAIVDGAKSAAQAFIDIWKGVKNELLKIFADIVHAFIRKMLLKMIEAIATTKGGSAGSGGLAALVGGLATGAGGNLLKNTSNASNLNAAANGLASVGGATKAGAAGLSGLGLAVTGIGAGVIGGIAGFRAGQQGGKKNIAAAIGGSALSGAALGFQFGGPIGAGIGAAIGGGAAIIGAIIGHFKKPEYKKVMKDIGKSWGVQISEELAKNIAVDSKRLGGGKDNREIAAVLHTSEIIAEAGGVEKFGVDKTLKAVTDLLGATAAGLIKAKDAGAQLQELFPDIAKASTDANGVISKGFRNMIAYAKAAGVEFEALTQWIDEQSTKLAGALNKMVTGFSADIDKLISDSFKLFSAEDITKISESLGDAAKLKEVTDPKTAPKTQPKAALAAFGPAISSAFSQAAKDAAAEVKRLSAELSALKAKGGASKEAIAALEKELKAAKGNLSLASGAVKEFGKHGLTMIEKLLKAAGDLSTIDHLHVSLTAAKASAIAAAADVKRLTGRLAELKKAGKQNTQEFRDLEHQLDAAKRKLHDAEGAVDKLAKTLKGLSGSKASKLLDLLPKDLRDKLRKNGGNVAEILKEIAKNVQPEFTRLTNIALASFNAMIKAGKSPVEAMMEIGESVDTLIGIFDKLKGSGLKPGPAFEQLKRFRELVKNNQPLIEATTAIGDALATLFNLDGLTPDVFKDLLGQATSAHDKLKKAGFTENEILKIMVPTLETIQKIHDETGMAIDAETQKLIDAAKAQGLLKDKGESTNDILMEGLSEIILALGGTLPDSFKKFREAAEREAQKVKDAINNIPRNVDIRVNYDHAGFPGDANGPSAPPSGHDGPSQPPGGPSRPPGAAMGGMVGTMGKILPFLKGGRVPEFHDYGGVAGRMLPFVPRGTDTVPAMLTPGELILNATQQRHLGQALAQGSKFERLAAAVAAGHRVTINRTHALPNTDAHPMAVSISIDVNLTGATPETAKAYARELAHHLPSEIVKGGKLQTKWQRALKVKKAS